MDFIHLWREDRALSKILRSTIPIPVFGLKVNVTDFEFFCVKCIQCQFLQSLWLIWIMFCVNRYKILKCFIKEKRSCRRAFLSADRSYYIINEMLLLSLRTGFGRDSKLSFKRTWDRLKDRWIQLHLVLSRLNPGEWDRELFLGGAGGGGHSMRILRVFIMTEHIKVDSVVFNRSRSNCCTGWGVFIWGSSHLRRTPGVCTVPAPLYIVHKWPAWKYSVAV